LTDDTDVAPPTPSPAGRVRARTILKVPIVWILPLGIPAMVIALVTSIYIGSVEDPVGHLHGLSVRIAHATLVIPPTLTASALSPEIVDYFQRAVAQRHGA
jgi:hypothetical protein